MAVLGIRKNAWQALSDRDKTILRFMGDVLALGVPAQYETPQGVEWFVFSDFRFQPVAMAYFGCVAANLGDIPAGYELPLDDDGNLDKRELRDQIKAWCEDPARTNPLVLPRDVEFSEGGNRWQELLDAQGCPSAMQMADSVPSGWEPVGEEVPV